MFGGLGGLGSLGDIGNLMKMAKDFQGNMKNMKEELAKQEFSGASGGGTVKVTVSGAMQIKNVAIKPEAVDMSDLSLLEDMVLVATNNALDAAKKTLQEKMQEMTGGAIDLPSLF
jgi:DNA-binding YbaB/EbfC family protein